MQVHSGRSGPDADVDIDLTSDDDITPDVIQMGANPDNGYNNLQILDGAVQQGMKPQRGVWKPVHKKADRLFGEYRPRHQQKYKPLATMRKVPEDAEMCAHESRRMQSVCITSARMAEILLRQIFCVLRDLRKSGEI
eukprot:1859000-Rhodomonas_salina.2